jgi:hypothetical protein
MSESQTAPTAPRGIDPRGPRFAAGITSVLLLVATFLALVGVSTATGPGGTALLPDLTFAERAADPGFLAVVVIALLFVWGAGSPRTAPWGVLYRSAIQPRLAPPSEFEDPRPPRFAQGVGLLVTGVGVILHLIGVPWALPIAAGMAFIAAFLNAVFGLCLGCQLYLVLQRAGLVGRARTA